jgi:hypothetical protein
VRCSENDLLAAPALANLIPGVPSGLDGFFGVLFESGLARCAAKEIRLLFEFDLKIGLLLIDVRAAYIIDCHSHSCLLFLSDQFVFFWNGLCLHIQIANWEGINYSLPSLGQLAGNWVDSEFRPRYRLARLYHSQSGAAAATARIARRFS